MINSKCKTFFFKKIKLTLYWMQFAQRMLRFLKSPVFQIILYCMDQKKNDEARGLHGTGGQARKTSLCHKMCCWWLFERKPKQNYKRNLLGIPKITNILEFAQVRSAFSPDFGGKYRIFLLIKIKIAERGFDPRTSGLWAQHASTAPLCFACLWVVSLLLRLVRVPRCLCEQSAKVGMIGTQGTFKVKWW